MLGRDRDGFGAAGSSITLDSSTLLPALAGVLGYLVAGPVGAVAGAGIALLTAKKGRTAADALAAQGAPPAAQQAAQVAQQAGYSYEQIIAAAVTGLAGLAKLLAGSLGAPANPQVIGVDGTGGTTDYVTQATEAINWDDPTNWSFDVTSAASSGGGDDGGWFTDETDWSSSGSED